MQNDQLSSAKLLQQLADEEKKKQLLVFLQRRQQFRSHAPPHPASEYVLPLPSVGQATQRTADPHTDTIQLMTTQATASAIQELASSRPSLQQVEADEIVDIGEAVSPTNSEPHVKSANADPTSPAADSRSHDQPPTPLRSGTAFCLVVACSSFRHLPSLSDKTKDVANQLFNALVDSHFGQFSRRGSRLLLNPSVIEFQDTMKEMKELCVTESGDSAFFLCLATHGARVTAGVNEGSYVLFSETHISSEEEFLLTAIHEHDLAKMIHEIPSKHKLLALELCQVKQAKEKPGEEAPTIVNRIHENFTRQLFDQLVKLELARQKLSRDPTLKESQLLSPSSGLFNTVILDSCVVKSEAPVHNGADNVSNFLHRLNDAFHGAAATIGLEDDHGEPSPRSHMRAQDICRYVKTAVERDAQLQNDMIKTEYKKQIRTKYELVAEFEDVTHSPQLFGFNRLADFTLGNLPAPPELGPRPPRFVSSTLSSIIVTWGDERFDGFLATTSVEVPTILGYHIQIRGDGRACEIWRRASDFQLLPFDRAVRVKIPPPTSAEIRGLPSDMAFRFRIRARSAGGWGPFSEASAAFRTQSVASVKDQFSTANAAFQRRGVHGLVELMKRYEMNGEALRTCIEFLSRMAIKDPPRVRPRPDARLVPTLDTPLVVRVCITMHTFSEDFQLVTSSSLFIGRLAQSSEAWRKCLVSIKQPHDIRQTLQAAAIKFAVTHPPVSTTAKWALARLRGVSGRHRMTYEDAARRIQGLYRTRKAKEYVRALANAIYTQMYDPHTGQSFFYNSKTGATSWSLPSFLSVSPT